MTGNRDDENQNPGQWGQSQSSDYVPHYGPQRDAQSGTPTGTQGDMPGSTSGDTQSIPLSSGAPGQASGSMFPEQPGLPGYPAELSQPVVAAKAPRRFSTPVVATMVVTVGVVASLATGLIVRGSGSEGSSGQANFSTIVAGDRSQASATPGDGTVEAVAQRVLPSVVSIQVTNGQSGAEGSGSVISSDGLILTNNHVVSGANSNGANIVVYTNDGKQFPAKVVATDPQTDIAVIKAEGASDLTPITIGDPDSLQVGQSVIAVGSPLGLTSTVTSGIVSAKDRPVQAGGESGGEASLIDAIQTDAAINPGNSGGALVNLNGELIGIPSVIATLGGSSGESGSIGLGFAIPSDQAMDTAKQLIDTGRASHPMIGAQVDTRNAEASGARIVEVTSGGPAQKAGLKSGDVVTKVDDRLVDSGVSLIAAIRSHKVGDEVTLTVTNGDGRNEHEITVTLSASE